VAARRGCQGPVLFHSPTLAGPVGYTRTVSAMRRNNDEKKRRESTDSRNEPSPGYVCRLFVRDFLRRRAARTIRANRSGWATKWGEKKGNTKWEDERTRKRKSKENLFRSCTIKEQPLKNPNRHGKRK